MAATPASSGKPPSAPRATRLAAGGSSPARPALSTTSSQSSMPGWRRPVARRSTIVGGSIFAAAHAARTGAIASAALTLARKISSRIQTFGRVSTTMCATSRAVRRVFTPTSTAPARAAPKAATAQSVWFVIQSATRSPGPTPRPASARPNASAAVASARKPSTSRRWSTTRKSVLPNRSAERASASKRVSAGTVIAGLFTRRRIRQARA